MNKQKYEHLFFGTALKLYYKTRVSNYFIIVYTYPFKKLGITVTLKYNPHL